MSIVWEKMLTDMFMLELIYALSLKCRGIDDEVLRYSSKEVELQFEDEVDGENEINVGKYVKYIVDKRDDLQCRLRH